jgi:choline dehydrogenase-like flavoprotein
MYDAIVVGAWCAGSPTAMLLARQGYRVLLVDRATFRATWPSRRISLGRRGALSFRAGGYWTRSGLTLPAGAFTLMGACRAPMAERAGGAAPARRGRADAQGR